MAYYEGARKPQKAAAPRVTSYVCRTCRAPCGLSDDDGKTHFCAAHTPKGFWPHEREKAPRPAPVAALDSDEF